MKCFLLAMFFVLPFGLSAQGYSESLLVPGADPGHSEPLTREGLFKIHMFRFIGPRALLFDTLGAGINELQNDPGSWTRDGSGFAKRFGSIAGRSGIRETLGFGLDTTLHTDPRVFRSTHTNFGGRLYDALSQVVITRTESGGHVPAIASVGSAFAAGQIQTLWMPPNDAHVKDGLVSAGFILLGDASRNVFREFWPDIRRKIHHDR